MKRKETMTPGERFLAVLTGQKPDRITVYYRATDEAHGKLMKYLGCGTDEELFEKLHIDRTVDIEPKNIGPHIEKDMDIFGCRYGNIEYAGGVYSECNGHPLALFETVEEIRDSYTWPSADWFDYAVVPEQAGGKDGQLLSTFGWEPFLLYKYMRGEEQAFIDLVENPDIVQFCMEKLFTFFYEKSARTLECAGGRVLLCDLGEDLGAQTSLLYSPEHIRKYFLPLQKRMIDMAHQAGAYVSFHSDGSIRDIIPDLIEIGVDILDPVQWRCSGMDREGLKRDFGDMLVFHGGIDNQYTLPFGSAEEVRQEVIDNLKIFGKDGGYILGPCHNIQHVGPMENIVTMYETAYEYGFL